MNPLEPTPRVFLKLCCWRRRIRHLWANRVSGTTVFATISLQKRVDLEWSTILDDDVARSPVVYAQVGSGEFDGLNLGEDLSSKRVRVLHSVLCYSQACFTSAQLLATIKRLVDIGQECILETYPRSIIFMGMLSELEDYRQAAQE